MDRYLRVCLYVYVVSTCVHVTFINLQIFNFYKLSSSITQTYIHVCICIDKHLYLNLSFNINLYLSIIVYV